MRSSDLVRFGIAIPGDLLADFDQRIARKGHPNRSEAIRDLIRADLVEHSLFSGDQTARGGDATGALLLVYDHHVRELSERLVEMQHDLGHHVVSTLHVHLDHDHCLEVIVLRGPAKLLSTSADRILATKGVVHGKLTLTAVPRAKGGTRAGHRHARPAK
jgi:CopG family nickel-responsive transcriptional regulator